MLTDLEDDPLFLIVDAPYSTFVLEARTSDLGRGVNTPFVRGIELSDNTFVDEASDGSFEGRSGSEGPCRGPLSLDRDLRGGIGEGLGGHEAEGRDENKNEDYVKSAGVGDGPREICVVQPGSLRAFLASQRSL